MITVIDDITLKLTALLRTNIKNADLKSERTIVYLINFFIQSN